MVRTLRLYRPHTIHHVTCRFIEREFLISTPQIRDEYLRRAGVALKRTDCRVLAFAVMSNHMHWVLQGGEMPVRRFIQPLNSGFARWLNRLLQRIGPVFAHRFDDHLYLGPSALRLIAYVHNNPVRARVVARAVDSDWTSHQAYLGLAPAPRWLSIDDGMRCCGFEPSDKKAFADTVETLCDQPIIVKPKRDVARLRSEARAQFSTQLELSDALRLEDREVRTMVVRSVAPEPIEAVGPLSVLGVVARYVNLPVFTLRSRSRHRAVVDARRVAMHCWFWHLRRPQSEMAAALGVSSSTACKLAVGGLADTVLAALAAQIATEIVTNRGNEN